MKRRGHTFSLRSRLLVGMFVTVTDALEHGLDDRSLLDEGGDPFRQTVPEGTFVQIRSNSGTVEASSIVGREVDPDDIPTVPIFGSESLFRTVVSDKDGAAPFRIRTTRLRDGRELVVGVSLADEYSALDRLNAI